MPRIAKATISINGKAIEDLRDYQTNIKAFSASVRLMTGYDYKDVVPENTFKFSTIPQMGVAARDWNGILDGNANVQIKLAGGKTIIWSGVRLISVEESQIDGEAEYSETINCFASDRNDA